MILLFRISSDNFAHVEQRSKNIKQECIARYVGTLKKVVAQMHCIVVSN